MNSFFHKNFQSIRSQDILFENINTHSSIGINYFTFGCHCFSISSSLFCYWQGEQALEGLHPLCILEIHRNHGKVGILIMGRVQQTKYIVVFNSKNVLTLRNINRM